MWGANKVPEMFSAPLILTITVPRGADWLAGKAALKGPYHRIVISVYIIQATLQSLHTIFFKSKYYPKKTSMFYINGLNVEQQNFDNVSSVLLLFEITHGIAAVNY